MKKKINKNITDIKTNYLSKYGFSKREISYYQNTKHLSKDLIEEVSIKKGENEWMRDLRLKSYQHFIERGQPWWGPNLDKYVDLNEYKYFLKATESVANKWEKVPKEIKDTFSKLGIVEAEQKWLAGVSTQYESEAVYHSLLKELEDQGVIFLDTDTALKKHPELFQKYFGSVVNYKDNKYAALNTAIWSGGSFIYVPKGVKVDKPLQSYFRINARNLGQFERTLIIVEEGASVHYIEGCTAPVYSEDSLHAAVVEVIVKKNAHVRYTTIQNWSKNVINLVTKRAVVHENGFMEWIDGNLGSKINMKYPSCMLIGKEARGYTLSVAIADDKNIIQDTGSKMIHLASNTKSQIISKTIAFNHGESIYRGKVFIDKKADNCYANVTCDTLLIDDLSKSVTLPTNINNNNSSFIEHEATISKISDTELSYLQSKGICLKDAIQMITIGYLSEFASQLPMEYAVELNQLIKINIG
ncbi:Fe-S cluster assembly protein SufB [Mycoplasma sp. SG1]|uniref:Fe-S cluster assembly protein SufB n=1 Tax=Mycoplasma sp. SG1 TaxID=2810348 RepID=UPI00202583BD|nr:Fe-S cluster assembly protein SufB [Mycoplasma sp. SG1]URM52834.1 Fe-S cluster assembly protein SufB [Mycoplasma sp. SG1]